MKAIQLNAAWWVITLLLMPYVLLLTVISILFVWCGPVYDLSMRANIAMEEWRYNLFVSKQ